MLSGSCYYLRTLITAKTVELPRRLRPDCDSLVAGRLLEPECLARHLDRLRRAARTLCGSREDAEDLVQETYARVLARPRRLRRGTELPYLLGVMRNTFISSRRTAARRPATVGVDPETLNLPQAGAGTTEPLAATQAREVLGAIASLPPGFRDAVVAVDVAGLSYDEAAKALHIHKGTITTRLFRGRKQVANALLGCG